MNAHAKLVYTVLGVVATAALFLQILGTLFGFIQVRGWPAIGASLLSAFLMLVSITALDPPKAKR